MKKIEDLKLSTKIIISIIIVILLIVLYCLIKYSFNNDNHNDKQDNELYDIVVTKENNWNLFYLQNRYSSNEFSGFIYDSDYNTIDSLPPTYIMSLVIDNYIASSEEFYSSKNYNKTNDSYSITISKESLTSYIKTLFGPDYAAIITETSYGCGRKISKSGNNYIIESKLPDSCGLLSREDNSYYVTHIDDYYQEDQDTIAINLKVAYIEEIIEEQYGDDDYVKTTYNVYSNKDKKKLLKLNVDSSCIIEENPDKSCYSYYEDYLVTLKKAQDNKYYFYSIAKGKKVS